MLKENQPQRNYYMCWKTTWLGIFEQCRCRSTSTSAQSNMALLCSQISHEWFSQNLCKAVPILNFWMECTDRSLCRKCSSSAKVRFRRSPFQFTSNSHIQMVIFNIWAVPRENQHYGPTQSAQANPGRHIPSETENLQEVKRVCPDKPARHA